MSDLISREKLKKEAESLRVTVMGLRSGKGILAEYAKHYRESFLRMIDEQPPVEPVRGEWIKTFRYMRENVNTGNIEPVYSYDCPVCAWHTGNQGGRFNFCPNCGADMRKEVAE